MSDSNSVFAFALVAALCVTIIAIWIVVRRRRAPRSEKSFTVRVIETQSASPRNDRRWLWDSLTPREMEVARLVALGRRNNAVANELHITINTVESHLKNIYRKLDVHSRVELTRAIRDLVE